MGKGLQPGVQGNIFLGLICGRNGTVSSGNKGFSSVDKMAQLSLPLQR